MEVALTRLVRIRYRRPHSLQPRSYPRVGTEGLIGQVFQESLSAGTIRSIASGRRVATYLGDISVVGRFTHQHIFCVLQSAMFRTVFVVPTRRREAATEATLVWRGWGLRKLG